MENCNPIKRKYLKLYNLLQQKQGLYLRWAKLGGEAIREQAYKDIVQIYNTKVMAKNYGKIYEKRNY